jgi:hypothetical protein
MTTRARSQRFHLSNAIIASQRLAGTRELQRATRDDVGTHGSEMALILNTLRCLADGVLLIVRIRAQQGVCSLRGRISWDGDLHRSRVSRVIQPRRAPGA